jgi:hypothetical protein
MTLGEIKKIDAVTIRDYNSCHQSGKKIRRQGSRADISTNNAIGQAMMDYRDGLLTTKELLFQVASNYDSSFQKEDFEVDEDVTFMQSNFVDE